MPPEGPELDAQRELRKVFDTEWPGSLGLLTGSTQVEPSIIDVCTKGDDGVTAARTEEQLQQDSVTHLESKYIILVIACRVSLFFIENQIIS